MVETVCCRLMTLLLPTNSTFRTCGGGGAVIVHHGSYVSNCVLRSCGGSGAAILYYGRVDTSELLFYIKNVLRRWERGAAIYIEDVLRRSEAAVLLLYFFKPC